MKMYSKHDNDLGGWGAILLVGRSVKNIHYTGFIVYKNITLYYL